MFLRVDSADLSLTGVLFQTPSSRGDVPQTAKDLDVWKLTSCFKPLHRGAMFLSSRHAGRRDRTDLDVSNPFIAGRCSSVPLRQIARDLNIVSNPFIAGRCSSGWIVIMILTLLFVSNPFIAGRCSSEEAGNERRL